MLLAAFALAPGLWVGLTAAAQHGDIPTTRSDRDESASPHEPPAGFGWSAPGECPDDRSVAADVARDRPPGSAPVSFRGVIVKQGETYRLDLHTWPIAGGEAVERVWYAERCETLAEAAVAWIALGIDNPSAGAAPGANAAPPPTQTPQVLSPAPAPTAPAVEPEPEPKPEPTPTSTAKPAPRNAAAAPTLRNEAARHTWTLGVGGRLDGRMHGSVSGGAGAQVAWHSSRWRIAVGADALFDQARGTTADPDTKVTIRGFVLPVDACVGAWTAEVWAGACLTAEAGWLHGEASGPVRGRSDRVPWLAARLGPELIIPAGARARIGLGANLGVAILPAEFSIAGLGVVAAPANPLVGGRARLEFSLGSQSSRR